MRTRFLQSLLVSGVIATVIVAGGDRLRAVSSGVVISQVYGAGGNSGAVLKNDYIELFNRGASSVSLAGMSVQYASTAGSTWQVTALPAVTLAPGQYLLVQESGGVNGAALPAADASGSIAMAAGAGKVALSATTTALSGVCPTGLVDFVGYGTGTNCFEGTGPTPSISVTLSAFRAAAGCTDTDSNSADFATGTPSARNTATTLAPCGGGDSAPSVTTTTPAASATNIATNATITINFSESVTASASAFSIACPAGSPKTFTQSASPATTFTLTPTSPLPNGTTCAVKVTANQITDTDAIDPPDQMAADFNFTFSTISIADVAPSVVSTVPANGASNVGVTSPIVINFSESVSASGAAFALACGGNPQAFGQSASPATTFTLTPASSLPPNTSCTFSITANQISDTDANDPPDNLAANVSVSFTTPPAGAGIVMINEVDADTPGSDTAEFIELFDGGVGNTPLDGLVLVLYDGGTTGSGNLSYASFDLDGYTTNAQGYFTLGNPGVPGVGLVFDPGAFGLLQNGADAIGLYVGNASDFPVGTVRTTTNLQDAIVYGTDDPSASGLTALLNSGQKIVNENATGNSQTESSQRCPNGQGGFRNTSTYYPGAPTPGAGNNCPAVRPPSDVVISQVYGGGGNSGATYTNDFVELYNRGTATADLTGWSLQYASSTGSGWDTNKQPLGGSIGAGEYYLISLASGGAVGASLPAANISGLINMAGGSGKIALVSSFTGLVGNCPIYDATIKDLVGYGSADCGEGSTTTAAGSNTTALFRKTGGSTDTDNNANDFGAAATPSPRRTAAIVELGPNVLTSDPRSGFSNTPRDATIQVTFTEPVSVDAGWFTLNCATTGAHASATFAESFGGQDHYITPNDNFTAGEVCTITILKDRIHDLDVDDSGPNTDTLPADYSWSFTVATGTAPPYTANVHATFGNPSAAGVDPLNYLMLKPEFTVSYNRDLGRPNWVSWHLSDDWTGSLTRVDTFRPDPQIPQDWYRVQSFDFVGSGFDRGHMTPNADRDKETSSPINQATFLMSNMVAQAPGNNQGPWASLEGYLRTLIDTEHDELYIVAGASGVGGVGSNGGVTNTLADGHVTVPAVTWKVALVLPKDNGDDLSRVSCSTRTIAVIMPNLDSIRPNAWETYLTTVDAVEALTGYDFFSNLPEPYQRCIEAGTNGNNPSLVKGDQTITFAQPADSTYGDAPFGVSATGGASGNPVTFVASGACSTSGFYGSTITVNNAGTCTVTASQAGSDLYNAAADVTRTFAVNRATPMFSGLSSPTIEAGTAVVTVGGVITRGAFAVQGGTVIVTLNGTATAVVSDSNGQFSATLPTASLTVANSPYSLSFDFGGDANLTSATAASTVTVIDTTAPTIDAHANVSAEATSANGPSVTYTSPATHDAVDGDGVATCAPASGSVFALGTTTVTCTATDAAGNAAAATTFTVTVADTTAPTIDAHANVSAQATSASGASVTYTSPATHDAVDGDGLAICAPASGSVFALGTTTVTCTATDAAGNAAVATTFTVTVVDTTAPTIDPHANVIVSTTNPSGTAVTYVSPATHDAVSGNGVAVCAPISGSVFALGNTTVTCTASDAAGNAAVATTFTVIVGENRLGRFVVLGREQAWLREGSQVTTGDVGAASAIAAPRGRRDRDDDGESDRTVEVRFGENAKMLQAGSRVVGDTVWLRNRSQVFDVLYNELENRRGSILGSQTHPVALPYVAMPTALSVNAGTQSVSVAKNATLTLAPGSYGRVQVREKATLILTGGRYDFVSLDVDQNATVLFRAATDLRITTELDTDDKSKLIVDPSVSGLSAANVLITVLGGDIECRHEGHGSDGDDAGQTVAHIGEGNTITANIYAPNGTLWIRAKTVATGAFIGARVRIGERVALTLDSYYR